ncbi:origin of replication binding protein [Gigaspora rosea]|uniref:Origin of replication binding protein n=1 Tax=Gigaspora rosea TaxID=44941 RepID=A0A397VMQ4_9GLOM|nr:origin of replication binding protein [Gigaspora rosea]
MKWGLIERLSKAVKHPRPLVELSGNNINVKEMEDAPEAYPDFMNEEPTTTLIRSPVASGKTKTLREILNSLAKSEANLPCFNWVSYHKTLSNETKSKIEVLQKSGLRVCHYQENEGNLAIRDWDVIIVQVESTHRLNFHEGHSNVVILDEANGIMHQIASGIHARESENAMRDLLKSAVHVVAADAFANESTLAFLRQYRGENIRVFDNKYQPRKSETVKILYDSNKGSEAIRKGLEMLKEGKRVVFSMTSCKKARAIANQASKLQKPDGSFILSRVYFSQMDGKQRQDDFADINATWSGLDCVIYTSTVESGISFEIPNYFDAIIAISNIKTGVHAEAFTQMLYRTRDCPYRIVSLYNSKTHSEIFKEPNRDLIRAELLALRPGDLPTAIKGHREWNKIADCYILDSSPAVETYIEVEYQRRLSAKYFPEILCSLIANTGASLELIAVEDTKLAKASRTEVSHTIKNTKKRIESSDAELIVNAPDINPNEAEMLKLNPERSFADNMTLQRHYLWRTYASGDIGGNDDIRNWSINNDDWIKLCDIDFVKKFNSPEPLQHFRRLAYFRRQGFNAINSVENLKIKEEMQWEDSHESVDLSSVDLHKFYLAKQWEAVHNLVQSIGFNDIDDTNILSGDDIAKTFDQSREKIVKIREDALLLFGFKTRAKGLPDLNATIKFINAILGNWCGYTIKSGETRIGPRTNRIWKKTYWIHRVPPNGAGFETIERIMAIKLNDPNYHSTDPILPPYKPESINEIQKLFDSILVTTDITISEKAKLRCSVSSNNKDCEESSCNNVNEESATNLSQSPSIILTQDRSNDFEQFSSITETKKEIPELLTTNKNSKCRKKS